MINKQIKCMRLLNIPEYLIQNTIKKYSGKNLIYRLIECEEKYSNCSELTEEEIKFNNYSGSLDKMCHFFDRNELICRMNKHNCIACEDNLNL